MVLPRSTWVGAVGDDEMMMMMMMIMMMIMMIVSVEQRPGWTEHV